MLLDDLACILGISANNGGAADRGTDREKYRIIVSSMNVYLTYWHSYLTYRLWLYLPCTLIVLLVSGSVALSWSCSRQ
jgi:hypothetical protein